MTSPYKCRNCGRRIPISRSGIGLCEGCEKANARQIVDGKAPNESPNHTELKGKSGLFLTSLGCTTVSKEVYKIFRWDVMGWKNNNEIHIVECGGTSKHKLDYALLQGYKVYIWPYGASEPTKYDKSMHTCHCCGAIISRG